MTAPALVLCFSAGMLSVAARGADSPAPAGADAKADKANLAAPATPNATAATPAKGVGRIPDITITGKKPPVEQGERSRFLALPPRNLVERPLTESPGLDTSTSVIGKEEIRWLEAYSVIDAMRYVPGAWTETRGRKVKQFISVRGQRYPYPEYLIDGAWQREFHESGYFLSAANVERIEVLRSSGALLLSPGGMAGLINVIPRTYEKQETQLDFRFGSDNTSRTELSHGNRVGNISYALGLGYRHTDGGPEHDNASENITNFYSRIVAQPVRSLTFSLAAMSFAGDRDLKLADPPASKTLQTRRDHYDPMQTYLIIGKARFEPSDRSSTELTANYGLRRFHGHRVGSADWLEKDYEHGLRLIQAVKLGDANTLRVGGMYNHWVSPTGKRFYVGRRGDLDTYALVVVDEHTFGRLRVNGGYRVSRTYVHDFGGFNVEGSARGLASVHVHNEWEDPLHTLSLGASYDLSDTWSLHANFVRGQISARNGMLDENLSKPAAETRTKVDFGIKRAWDAFGQASLTAFYVHQKDAPILTSAFVTVNGEDYGLYAGGTRESLGLEFDARSKRLDCGLQFFFNAVAMQTRQRLDGDWDPDKEVPKFVLGGGVSYLIQDIELSLLAKRVCKYENERFLPGGSDPVELGDFTDVTAKVTYFFGKEKQHKAFFAVENLGNQHYSTAAGFPDNGIRFQGGLSLLF